MAKESNMNPVLLFAIAALLLSLGWLMKSFPFFIFAGLAPLFAITDHSRHEERFWNLMELILGALTLGLFCAAFFEIELLAISLLEGIFLTFAFLGYSFAYQRLGKWIGKLAIVAFWLAIEFAFLMLPWRNHFVFLGDSLELKPGWLNWTKYTGYLGTSFWILIANLLLYYSVLQKKKIRWFILFSTLLWITLPIGFSFWSGAIGISRNNMMSRYDHKVSIANENYIRFGEVIPATAAGISGLILLAAGMQNKGHKR